MFKNSRPMLMSLAAAALLAASQTAHAKNVLVVAPPPQSDSDQNIATLQHQAGNTVTFVTDTPANLTGYDQVWDVRDLPSTAAVAFQYEDYIKHGGVMLLTGENFIFHERNDQVVQIVADLGGGILQTTSPGDGQQVAAWFQHPIPLASVGYGEGTGVLHPGNGEFISFNAFGGTSIAFNPGTLTNAPLGKLAVVFDTNVLGPPSPSFGGGDQAFTRDLIHYLGDEPPCDSGPRAHCVHSGAPEPSTWALSLTGFALAGAGVRRRRRATLAA